ncbi:MAG: hypothetical protein EOO10_21290, partial [Chitinophagaceae bacterium]
MRVATCCCLLFFVFSFQQLNAQSGQPLTQKVINITLGEDGRLKSLPGFAFVQGYTYDIVLKVERPKKEYEAFIKNLNKRLDDTYEKLDDEAYPFTSLYSHLWTATEYTKLKQEFKDLSSILGEKDPAKAFADNPNEFTFFLGREFLQKALFGNSYLIDTGASGPPIYASFTKDTTIKISDWQPNGDTAALTIFTPNIEKLFLYKYFLHSRHKIEAELNSIKTKSFYSKMVGFRSVVTALSSLKEQINQTKSTVICDANLYSRYLTLTRAFYDDDFVKLLREGWVKTWVQQWLWRMDGNIALNPLGFTDEKLLATLSGFDTVRADAHNAHRASVVDGMIASKELNETKTDLSTFDTALK